jgi:ATP-dependent DNA ligase
MSDALATFVADNYSKAVKIDLSDWLQRNPPPAICECKFDGIRVFLFKSGEKLLISSKHGGIYTPKSSPKVFSKLPEFVRAPNRVIIDGEYVSKDGSLHFFDVLQVDDRDLRSIILQDRKKVLHEIFRGTEAESEFTLAQSFGEIQRVKEKYIEKGFEGIIVKNPLSTYGQPGSWLKMKKFQTVDCFVIDYEETQEMKRTGIPRSWFVGVFDEKGEVVNLGKVGAFIEKINPSHVMVGSVIEVRYQEVTRDRKLRQPFIVRIRHDKTVKECLFDQLA